MKEQLSDDQVKSILSILDEAIADETWTKSSFLRVIGKNLTEIREKLVNHINNNEHTQKIDLKLSQQLIKRQNMQEVFITLYSNEGNYVQSWERIIANLPKQMISRPIYANEIDARSLIKSKENKYNEAYVAIYIDANDILTMPDDKIPKDRFGKSLMNLKDQSVKVENISRFVHQSGVYNYNKNRLIKVDFEST